ncbi:hypothetical protein HZ326_19866 [Fusarium oxysporum f. sp. albedinis]|nr:hypothetical protein HZ326_19866 [Fusarium oxysporum f. sp. albedinis]
MSVADNNLIWASSNLVSHPGTLRLHGTFPCVTSRGSSGDISERARAPRWTVTNSISGKYRQKKERAPPHISTDYQSLSRKSYLTDSAAVPDLPSTLYIPTLGLSKVEASDLLKGIRKCQYKMAITPANSRAASYPLVNRTWAPCIHPCQANFTEINDG